MDFKIDQRTFYLNLGINLGLMNILCQRNFQISLSIKSSLFYVLYNKIITLMSIKVKLI
jgi:hypothetical protein